MSSQSYNQAAGSFGALASGFVIQALGEMIPWLMTMTVIVLADLVAGITKSLRFKQTIRFSKAVRDTMAKFCTYFAVVVCFAMYDVASGNDNFYAEAACFCVMVIEAASIASNILKYHGYNLDFNRLVAVVVGRKFEIAAEDVQSVIRKDEGAGARTTDEGATAHERETESVGANNGAGAHEVSGKDEAKAGEAEELYIKPDEHEKKDEAVTESGTTEAVAEKTDIEPG